MLSSKAYLLRRNTPNGVVRFNARGAVCVSRDARGAESPPGEMSLRSAISAGCLPVGRLFSRCRGACLLTSRLASKKKAPAFSRGALPVLPVGRGYFAFALRAFGLRVNCSRVACRSSSSSKAACNSPGVSVVATSSPAKQSTRAPSQNEPAPFRDRRSATRPRSRSALRAFSTSDMVQAQSVTDGAFAKAQGAS